jgi:hypothetical protein
MKMALKLPPEDVFGVARSSWTASNVGRISEIPDREFVERWFGFGLMKDNCGSRCDIFHINTFHHV